MGQLCFISLFPAYFELCMESSILGRGLKSGAFSYSTLQIRDFSRDKHRRVDDSPYGGGAGLVMTPEPVVLAIEEARSRYPRGRVILTSPQGQTFDQGHARRLSQEEALIFVCGHYEGVDERVRNYVDEELSLGDFILTGGELAAAVMAEAVCRLWPGVLGNVDSIVEESFSQNLLEYPHYTRPYDFRGDTVPDILLSGHHAEIDKWRKKASFERTRQRRPDLL